MFFFTVSPGWMNLVFILFSKKSVKGGGLVVLVTMFCCQREKKKNKAYHKKKIFESFQPVNIIVWEWKVTEPFKTVIILAAFVSSLPRCAISLPVAFCHMSHLS